MFSSRIYSGLHVASYTYVSIKHWQILEGRALHKLENTRTIASYMPIKGFSSRWLVASYMLIAVNN